MTEVTNTKVSRFISSEDGPTAVEYAVMLALVAMASSAAVMSLGVATAQTYADSSSKLEQSMSGSSASTSGTSGSFAKGNGSSNSFSSPKNFSSPTVFAAGKGSGKKSVGDKKLIK